MMREEAQLRLNTDPEFVFSKRHHYSIIELEDRYPEGCPDNVIASVLMLTELDVQEAYARVVERLRQLMGVEL